ncbi:hypothetical protein RVBP21_1770 [Pseudomonas phage BRkr]|nr:hypothetical protein RVBP21_1770 [Pseudomonas phage BRkr]
MANKIAIIHGTWMPDPDNETGWELAVVPLVQTYCNSNCTRYIPGGQFSLINLTDDTVLDKAINNSMSFTHDIETFIKVTNKPGIHRMTPVPKTGSITMHNLGQLDDEGEEYDVYLMIPSNINAALKDRCFEWDGMYLLRDIEVEEDELLELATLELLKQVRFGE